MSFTDQSSVSRVTQIIRMMLAIVSAGLCIFVLVVVAGHLASIDECAPEIGTDGCVRDDLISFIRFPGVPFLALGLLIAGYLWKTKDRS